VKTDPGLKADVQSELSFDPSVGAAGLVVTVHDGEVMLAGTVGTFREKRAAARVAGRVRGVRALSEDIVVDLAADHRRGDIEIASAIRARLSWDPALAKQELRLHVEDGVVTLSGAVDAIWMRQAAEDHVTSMMGVTALDNAITLREGPVNAMMKNAIRHALNRSILHEDNIDVQVQDGVVHLTGTVQDWPHREQASAISWSAVGTRDVVNEIKVV
jgi:osmotically-inducible protein OsmY